MGSRFAFGPFVLDPGAGTLLRNDDPVAVGHRGVKLLEALVRRPGEILGKAELMDAAWPGRAVEEGNLTVQIAQLRKLLGPADGGEWIATVPRVGYRFTGAINQIGGVKANTSAAARQAIDRRAALRQYQQRSRAGILCGWADGGPDH